MYKEFEAIPFWFSNLVVLSDVHVEQIILDDPFGLIHPDDLQVNLLPTLRLNSVANESQMFKTIKLFNAN